MSTLRFKALAELPFRNYRQDNFVEVPGKLSELFCSNVFSEYTMREYLTKEAFNSIMDAIKKGSENTAPYRRFPGCRCHERLAISKGSHPLTPTGFSHSLVLQPKNTTLLYSIEGDNTIERFNGANVKSKQEPDASSFPNGGIRNTFECKGIYRRILHHSIHYRNHSLYSFHLYSYTGETLDYKTPLLRALNAVDEAATDVCKAYFDKNTRLYIFPARLVLTGKTLLGHSPAKGQQLDDHYFGSIPTRVMNFMKELEIECMKLGIPVTTRHNEVAPNQFELAQCSRKVAHKHHFHILFHEKPFAGVNGSGKHNNWSLATDTGENLLSPGKNPKKNLQFLTFFVNTLKAVHDYADLLRASIASASNDHRLGANEAPPAIISAFIGSQLFSVLEELEKVTDGKLSPEEKTELKLNVVGKFLKSFSITPTETELHHLLSPETNLKSVL
ncbi:hypothetical protein FQR65_LT17257 [Abscondita terminalis]|nr:hypothetical protein FQR65_LT17257 [Abscondita terminalis]